MEDVLGARTDPKRFNTFLADWESILAHRVDRAVSAFAAIEGVSGLVLAGSLGRGAPWPLSDIDLLPILDNGLADEAQMRIALMRAALLEEWIDEGWWTGLDSGSLVFSRAEVARALKSDKLDVMSLLQDDRWYHSFDKGYGGRAVHDTGGLAGDFVRVLTTQRFSEQVVRFRLIRTRREIDEACRDVHAFLEARQFPEATKALRSGVEWLRKWLMENWGERDNSLGRLGSRFEQIALSRGHGKLIDVLNDLSDLDDDSVERRMEMAPAWVWERHDRSWRARRLVGEEIHRIQDARDALRVCSHYELRNVSVPPFPAWLAIPVDGKPLHAKVADLSAVVEAWCPDARYIRFLIALG